MANTEDTLFTWSVAARSDFRAVTDDGKCSERFKLALAATIAQGWDNNRDKPAWALAALMQALARTEVALATCLDLLWLSPADLLSALRERNSTMRSNRPRRDGCASTAPARCAAGGSDTAAVSSGMGGHRA